MKLDTTPQDVAVAGNFETTAFGMEASAHAFDIIADKIYTHKERAVIREICCNAHDSHIEAGNPEPFDVHLPTQLEPHFSVRDYGVGLSDEDIRSVYCNTFKSTKQNTNTQIGCLGLGSKSPFCLTDSFTIVSWYGGMCRTYSCYRDDQRKPVVALLTEAPSGEPNGLEVSFTVEDKDYEFEQEAVKVFCYWDYTPNLNNKDVVKEAQEKRDRYKFTGKDFGLSTSYGRMKAIMGNVAYKIPDELDEFDVDGYLRFELGEVSFDAGRESLSLDDKTKQAIKDKFKSVKDKLVNEAADQIDALPTDWERANLAYELGLGSLGKFMSIDLTKYELPKTSKEMMYFVRNYSSTDKGETNRLPLGDKVSYYEYQPRFQSRIRSYLKDNAGYSDKTTIVLLTKKQIDETGIEIHLVQDLDTLPKVTRSTGRVGCTVKTFTLDRYGSSWDSRENWDENVLDVNGEEMVYVEINRFDPVSARGCYGTSSNSELKRTLKELEAVGIKVPQIHGLKSVYTKTGAFKKGNWTHVNEYIEREVKKIAPKSYYKFDSDGGQLMSALSNHYENIPEVELWNEIIEGQPQVEMLNLCKSLIDLEIEEDTMLQDLYDEFMEKYPMLTLLNHWEITSEDNRETIASYIGGRVKDENNE